MIEPCPASRSCAAFRAQADRAAAELDLIRREEIEALKAEVAALRADIQALRDQTASN